MARNPMDMMKMANRLKIFEEQHPKTVSFVQNLARRGVQEGTVVEMKVTDPEGRESVANFRVTAEDLETLEMLRKMQE